jgi:hypothetical protein
MQPKFLEAATIEYIRIYKDYLKCIDDFMFMYIAGGEL